MKAHVNSLPPSALDRTVAFIVRRNWESKPGGDTDLAKKFSSMLNSRGWNTTVCTRSELTARYSAAFVFNLDRPSESYQDMIECKKFRIPYVLYPLHHRQRDMRSFLKNGTSGIHAWVAWAVGNDPIMYEQVTALARFLNTREHSSFRAVTNPRSCYRSLIENATFTAFSCEDEVAAVESDFSITFARSIVLPHAPIDFGEITPSAVKSTSQGPVICAARIEPRKNQLSVLKLASEMPDVDFHFYGGANDLHADYVKSFHEEIDKLANARTFGHVPLDRLIEAMSGASAYISLSWCEVVSLVDFLAVELARGCVLSTGSYLTGLLSTSPRSSVSFVDPKSDDIQNALRGQLGTMRERVHLPSSWSASAVTTTLENLLHQTITQTAEARF